jgi:hypothetical protein
MDRVRRPLIPPHIASADSKFRKDRLLVGNDSLPLYANLRVSRDFDPHSGTLLSPSVSEIFA